LRNRPELKLTLGTVLMFPFYRTWCLIFRLYSLLRNVIMYSTWTRKYVKISIREQDMHDIPPVRAGAIWRCVMRPLPVFLSFACDSSVVHAFLFGSDARCPACASVILESC
jgi:hypothetical protein